jgi:hypothetical protein
MTDDRDAGIAIERIAFQQLPPLENRIAVDEDRLAHRHNSHTFHLLEKGTVHLDIDFQQYTIKSASLIYIHPDQVHRTTALENVTVISLAMTNENLSPEYLNLLEDLVPAKPIALTPETFALLTETTSLCLKLAERKNSRLYYSFLKDACNTLVALMLSTYLEQTKSPGNFSRVELITKAFRDLLEDNYVRIKRPTDYAQKLALSTAYLNECVKRDWFFCFTPHPATYHSGG